jgi:hypothetical protein
MKNMQKFSLLITLVALVPVANAEQGDAADRVLTEQMAREAQATQSLPTSGYGDIGKTNVQSGQSKPKEKSDVSDTRNGQ